MRDQSMKGRMISTRISVTARRAIDEEDFDSLRSPILVELKLAEEAILRR